MFVVTKLTCQRQLRSCMYVVRMLCPVRQSACQHQAAVFHRRIAAQASAAPKTLVVVESPSKATKISGWLKGAPGMDCQATYGHVRDLAPRCCCLPCVCVRACVRACVRRLNCELCHRAGSVDPDDGFRMTWESQKRAQKRIADIRAALAPAARLVLATDADRCKRALALSKLRASYVLTSAAHREGEAISWHLLQVLQVCESLRVSSQHVLSLTPPAGAERPARQDCGARHLHGDHQEGRACCDGVSTQPKRAAGGRLLGTQGSGLPAGLHHLARALAQGGKPQVGR